VRADSAYKRARLLIAAGAALVIVGCSDAPVTSAEMPGTERPLIRVRGGAVVMGPSRRPITVSGQLAPVEASTLSFRSGGTVRALTVHPGDKVRAGQTLATLEAVELDAGVRQARETLEERRRDRQRAEEIFETGAISRKERDNAITAEALALAQLEATSYRAQRSIRATSDGVVLQRLVEPGANVAAGAPVLVLGQPGNDGTRLMLRVGISERDIVALKLGDDASMRFDAFPGKSFSGRVREIAASTDSLNGSYLVEIALLDPEPGMSTGMIGRATLAPKTDAGVSRCYLPMTALVEGEQNRMRVFLLEGNVAREHIVAVAFILDGAAALVHSLAAGTRVITDGAAKLRDGDRVVVVE